MKKIKKITSVLMAAAVCAFLFNADCLTASAEEPTKFYAKYLTEFNDWRIQTGAWNDASVGKELYYLTNGDSRIKDGDVLIVLSSDSESSGGPITTNVRLSNLTFERCTAVVHANGIDECYVLGGSYATINGNVTNAHVYDDAVCTFNNNIVNLNVHGTVSNGVCTKMTVGGTVDHLIAFDTEGVYYEYYNFAAGKLIYDASGNLKTDESDYSKTSSGKAPSAPAQTSSSGASDSGEYDEVPKTGESGLLLWLIGLSTLCFAGSLALRKSK